MTRKIYLAIAITTLYIGTAFGQTGVNTTTPQATLHVKETVPIAKPEGIIAPNYSLTELNDAPVGTYGTNQTGAIVYIKDITGSTTAQTVNITAMGYYYFDGSLWQSMGSSSAAAWDVVGSSNKATTSFQHIYQSGKVGIGNYSASTSAVNSTLEVDGSSTNKMAYNATGDTVNFTMSNLAYTTDPAGAFDVKGLKDGGTYTLAVKGATSGTATFEQSGITFHYVNNGATAEGRQTLYTFIVMGTDAYVWMTSGF
jgi:hypothetical protein